MKTILVPTDFSKVADNAIEYAAGLSSALKARLVLLHVYHPPVVASEVPAVIPTLEEVEKDSLEALKKIEKKLQEKHGFSLTIESRCRCGFAADEVEEFANKYNADLVVMGMHGAGYVSEKLIGSVTSAVMHKLKRPVLGVNMKAGFSSLKKIVFAADYNQIPEKKTLEPLKMIAGIFGSHIHILNILPEQVSNPTVSRAIEGIKLENEFQGIEHSFHYVESQDVVAGINEFSEEMKADLIVMVPRKHSFFHNLLHEPNTKKLAFHAHMPVLALHE